MEHKDWITCPLCGGEAKYKHYNETHIWTCDDCPFVAFEYVKSTDLDNLGAVLNEGVIDDEDK